MFVTSYKVRMSDTDMAQIIFFANQFRFTHEALEDFFEKIGISFDTLFHRNPFVFVIVHAESDYFLPLRVGDDLSIEVSIEKVGNSSLTFFFRITRGDELVGTSRIVNVCLDSESRVKMTIPDSFRKLLDPYL